MFRGFLAFRVLLQLLKSECVLAVPAGWVRDLVFESKPFGKLKREGCWGDGCVCLLGVGVWQSVCCRRFGEMKFCEKQDGPAGLKRIEWLAAWQALPGIPSGINGEFFYCPCFSSIGYGGPPGCFLI